MSAKALRRRSASEWGSLIAELEHGKEAEAAFCRRHGLSVSTLRWWRWRLVRPARSEGEGEMASGGFREVMVQGRVADGIVGSAAAFELRWSDGLTVVVPQVFDGAALRRLLEVLGELAC